MSDQTDTDDKLMDTTVSVSECTKTNVLQLNSSLNIISRKPSGNTVFIVPQQNTSTDDTESLSQLMSTFSPPSSALVDDKKIANNKLTLIPLNLNSQPSHSSIKLSGSTTPVKSLNEPSMKAIISPVISSKKVIISTPSSGLNQAIKTTSVNLSASNSGLNDKPIVTPLNNRLSSATNTKIFTISTQNNLKTLTQQSSTTNSSNSLPQQNISTINATSITNNPNKIQYVKIVNTANNTQHIQMHQQTIPKTVTTTKPALLATNNKAIKITTISANTNNNSIITTTTNNSNDNNNNNNDNISLNNNSNSNNNISTHSMLNNLDLNTTNTNRSFSSILSSVTPVTITSTASPIPKQQITELKNSEPTDALYESTNNISNQSNSSVKLHTYQLVSSNQPKITATTKTPMIQRIQSVNHYSNQPITKTIVSATAASNSNSSSTQPQLINNYKVLTQQLPATSSTQFTFKSLNTTNPNNLNKISITKSFSSNNSLDDLTTNRKQIITTVRNSEQSKQPITQIASSSAFINKNNSLSVSTVNPINVNNSNALEDNQKVEAFSKIFNTASHSTLASSSSSIQNNSPGKQRLNLNRNSGNYDQALASPPSTTSNPTQLNSSSAIPANLSSNNRKPCNCTKSMCLKLYCDCFAMGSFCHDCNCINCFNTLEHEDERNKAIKMVLDRNPQAFQSKIGKFTAQIALQKPTLSEEPMSVTATVAVNTEEIDEIQSRHIKGCNCKKSNCLKRYCECYLAKIQCSTLCKCVGCKNCDESTKNLIQMANASDMRKQQNINQQNPFLKNNKILSSHEEFQNSLLNTSSLPSSSSTFWKNNSMNRVDLSNRLNSFNSLDLIPRKNQDQIQQQNLNRSYAILTNDAIEVTCSKLIDKVAEEMSRLNNNHNENNESSSHMMDLENGSETNDSENNDELMETLIIEEFGRCLLSLIDTAEKRDKF